MSIRAKLKLPPALLAQMKAEREEQIELALRRRHHNTTGSPDLFSELIKLRLGILEMDQQTFAARTLPSLVGSEVGQRYGRQRTAPSLVTRVIQGRRSIPLGRVVAWGLALGVSGQRRMEQWIELVLWANTLRDVRRNLTEKNPSQRTLEAVAVKKLSQLAHAFRWGDGKDYSLRAYVSRQ